MTKFSKWAIAEKIYSSIMFLLLVFFLSFFNSRFWFYYIQGGEELFGLTVTEYLYKFSKWAIAEKIYSSIMFLLLVFFLSFFNSRFWFYYIQGGEELFGLTVTEYPNLQRIRKELGLLQKLYSLYNAVIENVNGYYDILWQEIDIEKINNELLEYQNR